MKKETWSKPELIVLLRNHPEETLQGLNCKAPGFSGVNNTATCANNNTGVQCHASNNKS